MSMSSRVNSQKRDREENVTGEGLTRTMQASCPQLAEGYSGPCHKGHMRCVRAAKRSAAKARNGE
jgi:hypothetical protein